MRKAMGIRIKTKMYVDVGEDGDVNEEEDNKKHATC